MSGGDARGLLGKKALTDGDGRMSGGDARALLGDEVLTGGDARALPGTSAAWYHFGPGAPVTPSPSIGDEVADGPYRVEKPRAWAATGGFGRVSIMDKRDPALIASLRGIGLDRSVEAVAGMLAETTLIGGWLRGLLEQPRAAAAVAACGSLFLRWAFLLAPQHRWDRRQPRQT